MKLVKPKKFKCDDCEEDSTHEIELEDATIYLCVKHKIELVTLLTSGKVETKDEFKDDQ